MSTKLERPPAGEARLQSLALEVDDLRSGVIAHGAELYRRWRGGIRRRAFRASCANLAAYVAMRQRDLRELQIQLMTCGLSSLGRCEARVIPNIDAVLSVLNRLCGIPSQVRPPSAARFFRGEELLNRNVDDLFGRLDGSRRTRIMVTLATEAADDYDFVRTLVDAGMDCARINCAHDSPTDWLAMIRNVRRASLESGRSCVVCADLGGPKLRTAEVRLPGETDRVNTADRIFLAVSPIAPAPAGAFRVDVTLPELLGQLKPGEKAWIDEGRIECVVDEVGEAGVAMTVCGTRPKGEKLRAEKGLNFPDSTLDLAPLTPEDLEALDVIANAVDMIGYSFVKTAEDVALLQRELRSRRDSSRPDCGVVLKIETAQAVRNLPELIVQSAGTAPTAVMIARGDLAIEIGYKRLAEMQEEILWLCEAAHVPVIWATQVLDNFVKRGRMSRAEFTDAAMAERADCVMLNKGPFVGGAVSALVEILSRMEGHQVKKTSRLRALHSW